MTIEERAKKYDEDNYPSYEIEDAYIQGAKDQQEIEAKRCAAFIRHILVDKTRMNEEHRNRLFEELLEKYKTYTPENEHTL